MRREIKASHAAKRLGVCVKFLMGLKMEGVLRAWRRGDRGVWMFDRVQVESLRAVYVGEFGTQDAAEVLGVSESTIRYMVSCGWLPDRRFVAADGRRLGKLRFKKSDVEVLMERKENEESPEAGSLCNKDRVVSIPSHRI